MVNVPKKTVRLQDVMFVVAVAILGGNDYGG